MSDKKFHIETHNLCVTYQNSFQAVNAVSLEIEQGKTFGLIGESGSGKSSIGKAILHLIPKSQGEIRYKGRIITTMQPKQMQMIFQDPYNSLNPRMQIQDLICEPLDIHKIGSKETRRKRVKELFSIVQLPTVLMSRYPTELSGGQRQRVGIARALAIQPEFIFCDEPTSSLDLHHELMILDLLRNLQKELNLTYLFVSHNLPLVTKISHEMGVMYRGELVEKGKPRDLIKNPKHPYTKALFDAVPSADPILERNRLNKLQNNF